MLGLGMPEALIPEGTGVLSALGMTVAPEVCDRSRTLLQELDGPALTEANEALEALERDALASLDAPSTASVERSLCLRYKGQSYDLPMAVDTTRSTDPHALEKRFHSAHNERFGWRLNDHAVEVVTARVRASGDVDQRVQVEEQAQGSLSEPVAHQMSASREGEFSTPVYARRALPLGGVPLSGPAIVIDPTSTTWVPTGVNVQRTTAGLLLKRC